jgi:hypothetical protein
MFRIPMEAIQFIAAGRLAMAGALLCALSGQSPANSLTIVSDGRTLFSASGTDDLSVMNDAVTSVTYPAPTSPAIEARQGTGIYQIPGTLVINSNPSEYYVGLSGYYETSFVLPTAFVNAKVDLEVVGDDIGNAFLNRESLGSFRWDAYGAYNYSATDPSLFHSGSNLLTFTVSNSGGGPTGLSCKAVVSYDILADVPEPGSYLLMLGGLAATLAVVRRQRT